MNEISRPDKPLSRTLRSARDFIRSQTARRLVLIGMGSGAVLTAFMLAISPTRYSLRLGMVPNATISAPRDVVDEVTTEHNRDLAAAAITPNYKYSEGVAEEVGTALDNVYTQYAAVRQYAQALPGYGENRRYSAEELDYAADMVTLADLRDYQLVTLMNAPQAQYDEMSQSLKAAVRIAMQGNVTEGQEGIAIDSILQVVGFKTSVSLLQNVVAPTLEAVMRPNMVIDQALTEDAREAARQAVEPVIYKQGQNIVMRGEGIVMPNQIAMLSSLGLLDENHRDYGIYLGAFLTAGLSLAVMILLMWLTSPEIVRDLRYLTLLYAALLSTTLLSYLAKSIQTVYLSPVALCALLLSVTIGLKPAVVVNCAAAVLSAFILGGAHGASSADLITLLVYGLTAGTGAALILGSQAQRARVLAAGALLAVIGFLSALGTGLLLGIPGGAYVDRGLMSLGGAAVTTLLTLALQPLSESLFNLPTYSRLLDLGNPDKPLLRRLLLEAPGTYHHSIIIANLAETAAKAIGANPLLARVGGYYHDIGKLKRPLYFKENQMGVGNVHDGTDPTVSAGIITSHVRDGLALARQYHLPLEVQQIIAQHHGDSRVAYFYSKAAAEADGPVDDEDFKYDGLPPQSAEAAVVMLCDTIEAAVRTLSSPKPEEISAFIWKLIKGKLEDGQLRNAPLTLADLHTIQESCAKLIHGIFHERIEYPSEDKKTPFSRLRSSLLTKPGAQGLPQDKA